MHKVIILASLSLSACGDPYANWPMQPAGYTGGVQMFQERETGCMYYLVKQDMKPMLRPDGTQIGCKK